MAAAFGPDFTGLGAAILGIDDDDEGSEWEGPLPELSTAAWGCVSTGAFPSGRGSGSVWAELYGAELIALVRHGRSARREWTDRGRLLRAKVSE
jgi:hypothetical protein